MHRERGTKAFIHVNHISHNLEIFKQLHPGKIIAVVKADAYGHGLEHVVPVLSQCDAFAVATLDEAMELRKLNQEKTIILLEGVFNEIEMNVAIEHRLDVVLHQHYQVDLLRSLDQNAVVDAWLKFDTGMNRLGFSVGKIDEILKDIRQLKAIGQIRLMSHFASSEEVACKQTQEQTNINQSLKEQGLEYSFCNTAAVLNGLADDQEWVRIGIGLFGISPLKEPQWAHSFNLKPAMHLMANIIATKHLSVGSKIGYGGHYKAESNMRIGIVGIGYADGYPWSEHNSQVEFNGQRVQVLGRVSMDMIAIDLTGIAEKVTGNEVTVWGENLPIESVARDLRMIPYALTCGITKRVKYHVIQ